ncbi:MAG: hypothetical protein M3O01_15240 [Pseudomonadota bacterium]|nr:hypothetical protein [Pseudomonadota bacterium]
MRSPLPRLSRFAARGLLALAFLLAQNTAALHWLSHAIEATHAKPDAGLPGHQCDECVTLGALGAGATSASTALALATAGHSLFATPHRQPAEVPVRLAFRSRAPPARS